MSKFKQKDIVIVSGQPHVWMTVIHTFGEGYELNQVVCIWFDTRNRLQRASFFESVLELAPIWNTPTLSTGSTTTGQPR